MKELFNRCYNATKKRGLITEKTTNHGFLRKITEELNEFECELDLARQIPSTTLESNEKIENELVDIILTCTSFAIHHGIDIEKAIERKVLINETRAD